MILKGNILRQYLALLESAKRKRGRAEELLLDAQHDIKQAKALLKEAKDAAEAI